MAEEIPEGASRAQVLEAQRRAAKGTGSVAVAGLDEFRRDLRKMVGKLATDKLKEVNHRVAEMVVDRLGETARQVDVRNMAGNRVSSDAFMRVVKSARASRKQTASSFRIGGKRYPDALGWEFGSFQYGQFPPWSGNQFIVWKPSGVGYVAYETVRQMREEIVEAYGDGIDEVAKEAFPD